MRRIVNITGRRRMRNIRDTAELRETTRATSMWITVPRRRTLHKGEEVRKRHLKEVHTKENFLNTREGYD